MPIEVNQPSMVADWWGYLIVHRFKADMIHLTSSAPAGSKMIEATWCVFCGRDRKHINHA